MEQRVTYVGVIYSKHHIGQQRSIQLDGAEQFGLIVHVDDQTAIYNRHGEPLSFDQLEAGMTVQVEHRLAMTMSIPPQTYAFQVTVIR